MVVLVHLPQDTERTIIPYLNKKETLEGPLNNRFTKCLMNTEKNKMKRPSATWKFLRITKKKEIKNVKYIFFNDFFSVCIGLHSEITYGVFLI